ncbi:MAG TPA: hypothetical protein VL737_03735 [Candidatus Pristimantibacillus sp.]|nr:hypothetical protein [Candidatus Pristimantibacillus sp.]
MSDKKTFEQGFNLYNIGGIDDAHRRPWYRRLLGGLGKTAADTSGTLEFKMAANSIQTVLPRFMVGGYKHVGLLAIPWGMDDELRQQYPDASINLAVISRNDDGRILAGELPEDVYPGAARLVVEHNPSRPARILAVPVSDRVVADNGGSAEPGPEIGTVLYRLPPEGMVSAALGFLVGSEALAVPRAIINRQPVYSMALTDKVMGWAQASGTPIV